MSDDFATRIADAILKGPGHVVTVPAEGVWIVRDGQAMRVQMPEQGEWFIKDNEIMEVLQSTRDGRFEDSVSYTIWVKREE